MSKKPRKGAAGIILLEVLASLAIIGLSMVLMARAHNQSVLVAHDSLQRNRAIWMARNMIERVRVNMDSISTYVTVMGIAGNPEVFCLNRLSKCINGQCNANEIVTFDIEQVVCEDNGLK